MTVFALRIRRRPGEEGAQQEESIAKMEADTGKDAAASRGMSRTDNHHPNQEETRKDSEVFEPWEGTWYC